MDLRHTSREMWSVTYLVEGMFRNCFLFTGIGKWPRPPENSGKSKRNPWSFCQSIYSWFRCLEMEPSIWNRLEIVTPWANQSSIHLTYEQGPRVIAVLNSWKLLMLALFGTLSCNNFVRPQQIIMVPWGIFHQHSMHCQSVQTDFWLMASIFTKFDPHGFTWFEPCWPEILWPTFQL